MVTRQVRFLTTQLTAIQQSFISWRILMSLSTLSASIATLAPVVSVAPVVPVVAVAPIAPVVSFRFWASKEPRFVAQLVADLYAVKAPGYVEGLFAALEAAGIQYRAPGFKVLIKVYSGKARINQHMTGGVLARAADEPILAWLDRVALDPSVKAIGIEILAEQLTKLQVQQLHGSLAPSKFDSKATDRLVGSFTFIAPPGMAPEAKPFKRAEYVALPVQHVPAGHVEPAPPAAHVEFAGDAPSFPTEPIVVDEPIAADDSVAIVEVDDLECRTLRELGLLWRREFGFNAPSKIRKEDLITLILAKRLAA